MPRGRGACLLFIGLLGLAPSDFGPHTFVRFLELEDGRLVRVRTGSYGYSK